jgi:7-cyano-7-deazaguanine reductase
MDAHDDDPHLRALQVSADKNAGYYNRKAIDASLLETFASPHANAGSAQMWEHIIAPEFTCLCPLTGQPDFATIEVFYAPSARCVESKAFKLYLGTFRNEGAFHEKVAVTIFSDLHDLLAPAWLLVVARFTPRGGIPFQPRVYTPNVPQALLYRV